MGCASSWRYGSVHVFRVPETGADESPFITVWLLVKPELLSRIIALEPCLSLKVRHLEELAQYIEMSFGIAISRREEKKNKKVEEKNMF